MQPHFNTPKFILFGNINHSYTPTDKPDPVAPSPVVYEEVASDSLSGQNKIIELKENVAYGPV